MVCFCTCVFKATWTRLASDTYMLENVAATLIVAEMKDGQVTRLEHAGRQVTQTRRLISCVDACCRSSFAAAVVFAVIMHACEHVI